MRVHVKGEEVTMLREREKRRFELVAAGAGVGLSNWRRKRNLSEIWGLGFGGEREGETREERRF